jgi:ammonia channel protein AmtB
LQAFVIGLLGGPVCYYGCQLKYAINMDDSLDAFGLHAVGGAFGGIMVCVCGLHAVLLLFCCCLLGVPKYIIDHLAVVKLPVYSLL